MKAFSVPKVANRMNPEKDISTMNHGPDANFLSRKFGLDGTTAVVTGAGSGLGRQAAITLATAGAQVALLGRRESALRETAELVAAQGGIARCYAVDITDSEALAGTLDAIEADMAPLRVLVNNAGVSGRAPLLDVSEDAFDQIFGVNVKAALFTATTFARRLIKANRGGSIVNICSLAARSHPRGLGLYGASKAALEHLTRGMAHEWAPHGINVNAINPGYIETDINRAVLRSPAGTAIVKALPRQRVGTPDALDGALLLLCSSSAEYITGSTLAVDDGQAFGVV